jgi:hypothetical protein
MHLPAQLGVQRHAKVFRCLGMRYSFAIHNHRYVVTSSVRKVRVCRLVFIKINQSLSGPVLCQLPVEIFL